MAEPPALAALPGLIQGGWRALAFAPFRPGIAIHRLYGDGRSGPAAALLRYDPGAAAPLHEHPGFEHVLVLAGSQADERGRYEAGTLAINPPGSRHRVWSEPGCVALLIWERPVVFLDAAEAG
jgi:anti-sigma factor ChrR (cupin superfamily)